MRVPDLEIFVDGTAEGDDGLVTPLMVPTLHVNWFPGVGRKSISEFERRYRWYRVIVDYDAGQPADVQANAIDDLDDVFGQEAR